MKKSELQETINKITKDIKNHQFKKTDFTFDVNEKYPLRKNQFISITEFGQQDFSSVIGHIEKVTGYTSEEFQKELFNPEGYEHFGFLVEFAVLVYEVLKLENLSFKISEQYYTVTFNMKKKNSEILRLERRIYILDLDESNFPTHMVEFWEDVSPVNNSKNVEYGFYVEDKKQLKKMYNHFNNLWKKKLGIRFTDKQIKILQLYDDGNEIVKIKEILDMRDDNMNYHIKNIKDEINNLLKSIQKTNPVPQTYSGPVAPLLKKEKHISQIREVQTFIRKYKLLSKAHNVP